MSDLAETADVIAPDVPSMITNLTVIMLAERVYQRVYAAATRRLP